MSKEFETVLAGAKTLAHVEKLALIEAIAKLLRVDESENSESMQWDTQSFYREMDQRLADYDNGTDPGTPATDVFAAIEALLP